MEMTMTLKRWLPTFLAFPIGGYLAYATVGSVGGPGTAAAAGERQRRALRGWMGGGRRSFQPA